MGDSEHSLLELRMFKLHPGTREEFHRISRDGTVPLMRQLGITVVAHGPSLNDDESYHLLRTFSSEQERIDCHSRCTPPRNGNATTTRR